MKKVTRFGMWQIKALQYGALFSVLFFASVANWSVRHVLLAILFYYAYSGIGVSMMMHRYWAHRGFEFRSEWLKWALTVFSAYAGRGSPMAWVHIHRTHHRNADKEGDPHRPGDTLQVFSFGTTKIHKFVPARVADLLGQPLHRWLHDYYLLFIIGWVLVLLSVGGFTALYFAWLLPVVMYQLAQDIWNHYGHKKTFISYQNWGGRCTKETNYEYEENYSQNNGLLFPLVLGEAWHNDHHQWPNDYRPASRTGEADPIAWLIERIKK